MPVVPDPAERRREPPAPDIPEPTRTDTDPLAPEVTEPVPKTTLPESPSTDEPVANVILPDNPTAPAGTVARSIDPDPAEELVPENTSTLPPKPLALGAPANTREPPLTVDTPTDTETEPAAPPAACPEPMETKPELP